MDINRPLPLLAGLTPIQFMRRHWQKKPLLIRQAIPASTPLLSPTELFQLASQEQLPSRLITRTHKKPGWNLKHGPFSRRQLPTLSTPGWTLLVQGVDGYKSQARQLLEQFRFMPDARLDDVMVSFATTGGGVGAHFDSYDVFLLQGSGRRRWRISSQKDLSLQADVPLKILRNFCPQQEFVLEAGDMLYLPPHYAHEGVALEAKQACMTYSIGFRAPSNQEIAAQLLQRLADHCSNEIRSMLYRDAQQTATTDPAALPDALLSFAQNAIQRALGNPQALAHTLGEYLSEPPAHVWFEQPERAGDVQQATLLELDPRTRMLYNKQHLFINGESFCARGKDATLMHSLANQRQLSASAVQKLSAQARSALQEWCVAGWLHVKR